MLIEQKVQVKWSGNNRKHYELKGYIYTKHGEFFDCKAEDLSPNSDYLVAVRCDNCGEIEQISWLKYFKRIHDGKFYCVKCGHKLLTIKKYQQNRLINGKSFKQWCLDNNREDILDRWDYNLNDCNPNEINYGTNVGYYFKCPQGLHKQQLHDRYKKYIAYINGYQYLEIPYWTEKDESYKQLIDDKIEEILNKKRNFIIEQK